MLLRVDDIDSFYGPSQVLFGMSLHVNEGQVNYGKKRDGNASATQGVDYPRRN
jgi:ABC-type arginine transport system ATPase subunit